MITSSAKSEVRLLFLCGGRRVKLLKSFRAALAQTTGGMILTTDTEAVSAAAFVSDKTFIAPPCSSVEAFSARVAEICAAEQITAIIPLICASVVTVPALMSQTNTLLISGDIQSVGICTDKRKTSEFLTAISVPTPEVINDPRPEHLPLFFRGRFSEGSRDACVVRTVSVLDDLKRAPYGIFTKYLPGREYTIDGYKDLHGRLVCLVSRERIRVRAGEVEQTVTSFQPQLVASVQRAVEALNFVGPITAQAIESEGEFYLTELNLRYGGGVTLSITAGMNSPAWLVYELQGGGSPISPDIKWGLGMVRYDEEFYFPGHIDIFNHSFEECSS